MGAGHSCHGRNVMRKLLKPFGFLPEVRRRNAARQRSLRRRKKRERELDMIASSSTQSEMTREREKQISWQQTRFRRRPKPKPSIKINRNANRNFNLQPKATAATTPPPTPENGFRSAATLPEGSEDIDSIQSRSNIASTTSTETVLSIQSLTYYGNPNEQKAGTSKAPQQDNNPRNR